MKPIDRLTTLDRWMGAVAGFSLAGAVAVSVVACSASQQTAVNTALASPAGQLFCAISGPAGTVVAGLIDAASGPAAPIAVIATGALQSAVQSDCAKAGGIPVSPPASPATAPQIAIVAPSSPTAAVGPGV